MALDILKKLMFSQGQGSTPKLIEWTQGNYGMPENSSHLLSLLKLVNSSHFDASSAANEMRGDIELTQRIMQSAGIDLDSNNIEEAVRHLEQSLVRSSVEKDVARRYKRAFSGVKAKVAVIAKTIAQWCHNPHPELAYMAGIIAEIPEMIMEGRDQEAAEKVRERVRQGSSRKEAELIEYGFDRDQFATKLFKTLGMPEMVIEAIRRDEPSSKNKELYYIVQFAKRIAEDFSDKSKTPSSIWNRSQQDIQRLNLNITKEEWSNKISLLFVNALEFDLSC